MEDHVAGKPVKHSSYTFSQATKSAMLQNNDGAKDGDDEEDGPVHPIGSPLRRGARGRVTTERHQSWGWRCWCV